MVVMILRGPIYLENSIQWEDESGDPVYCMSRGDSISFPKGTLSPNDYLLVVCCIGEKLPGRLRTFEITHWWSVLYLLKDSLPVPYDKFMTRKK
jgi:hypothetical protein